MSRAESCSCRVVINDYDYNANIDSETGMILVESVNDIDKLYIHGSIPRLNLTPLVNLTHASLESCDALNELRLPSRLESLDVLSAPSLTQLDLSSCSMLRTLRLEGIPVSNFVISSNHLRYLSLINLHHLQQLTISQPQLECLIIVGASHLTILDLSTCLHLKTLRLVGVMIKSLDLSPCLEFEELHCSDCSLECITVRRFHNLFIHSGTNVRVVNRPVEQQSL